ncbi:CBS domain-containing protein [Candidatus Nitrosotalea bavarica]|uniref:CBS domain-containing protein n=1 Tax=Candidatus Nitrosotalea bavarica TaxID=1903277 RepID=UPI000C704553|nr:CBS domain-containing protein [Candidatus Nitrosotalea bavarica]
MKLKNDSINQVIKKTIVVTPRTSLLDARAILLKHGISRLIVSEKEKPVGMLTEKDLVKAIYRIDAKPLEATRVSDVMSKDLVTVQESATLHDCAKLMLDNKISSVIVLHKDKTLSGIITKTDLASVFLTQATEPLQVSKIMTRDVITVKPADSLLYVESVLVNNKISRVVVERNRQPVGIITHRDFIPAKMPLWLKQSGDPTEVENYRMATNPKEYRSNQLSYLLTFIATDIMTSNPITVDVADDVSNVSLLMIRHGISGLPVVKGNLLVGIVTKTDIVRAIVKN